MDWSVGSDLHRTITILIQKYTDFESIEHSLSDMATRSKSMTVILDFTGASFRPFLFFKLYRYLRRMPSTEVHVRIFS